MSKTKFSQTKNFFLILLFSISLGKICLKAESRVLNQTIKGLIIDAESKTPLPGATIIIIGTNPLKGSVSDVDGFFRLENVAIGRYNLKIAFLGYEPKLIPEVLVTSGKEVVLTIELKETVKSLNEVVVSANGAKNKAMNTMSLVSARTFSVEEANRYAGGLDDPGRLVSAFAGVSTGLTENNGIVVRGNSPKGVLWRLEGVDIPNPNHFGDAQILGGGFVTALSSQVMGNSDFQTGAFAAEYGNALSGVFDMKMRTGNNEKREHSLQVGVLGIDVASEGPFRKGSKSSYLFNYRYSTFGLMNSFLPDADHLPDYQDLSFKMNFPTKKAGIFSIWGFGGADFIKQKEKTDSTQWEWNEDKNSLDLKMYFGALGLTHKYIFKKSYIYSSLVSSGNSQVMNEGSLNNNLKYYKTADATTKKGRFTFSSYLNHKFSSQHTNRSGFIVNYMLYNMNIKFAPSNDTIMNIYANQNGNSKMIQLFSQSKFDLTDKLAITAGIHYFNFALTGKNSIEPRASISWNFLPSNTITFGYGKHSQIEQLRYYFVEENVNGKTIYPNKKLDFAKADHFVLSYDLNFSEFVRLKIEPYYQNLYNVPVIANSPFSVLNMEQDEDFNSPLVNKGTGKNYGIDITIERFLNKGYYYLLTASIFESKYKGGDNIERKTLFNRNYVCNVLFGKEWNVGKKEKNNILGMSGRLYLMGGRRYTEIDEQTTLATKINTYKDSSPFTKQYSPSYRLDLSLSYRINKENHSSVFSLQYLNVLGSVDHIGYEYNYKSKTIKENLTQNMLPVLSYKIEF